MTLSQRDRAAAPGSPAAHDQAPASPGQVMMWFVQEQLGGPGVLNVPVIARLRGRLDVRALAAAMTAVTSRHEALRSTFTWTPDETVPAQGTLRYRVRPPGPGPALTMTDVRRAASQEAAATQVITARLAQTIDVTSGPPFTVDLIRTADGEHVLMWNIHHLVTDAWSNEVLWRDLAVMYGAISGTRPGELPPEPGTAGEFIAAQARHLVAPELDGHLSFWRERLADMPYLSLRPAAERAAGQYRRCCHEWFRLGDGLAAAVRALARRHATEPPVVLQAAFAAVLHRRSGARRLAIGVVAANREHPAFHHTAGYLSNVVPARIEVPPAPVFADFVAAVAGDSRRVAPHRMFPFLSILMDPSMPAGAIKAAEVVFQMPDLPGSLLEDPGFGDLSAERMEVPDGLSGRCDLELLLVPRGQHIDGVLRYAPDRYEPGFARALARGYQAQLAEAAGAAGGHAR